MTQPRPKPDDDDDDDDGVPVLTGATAAALREFLAEAEAAKAKAAARGVGDENDAESLFSEDWGLSQFWYTDETAETVAAAVIKAAQARAELARDAEEEGVMRRGGGGQGQGEAAAPASASARRLPRIACVACPSLFRALRASREFLEAADAHLFEFDDRFAKLGGGFSHYDYRRPRRVSAELAGAFDAVVADPPYLSAECLKKTAVTMRLLGAGGGGCGDGRGGGGGANGEEKEEEVKEGEAGGRSGNRNGNDEEQTRSSTTLPPPPPVFVLLSGAVQRHRAAAYLGLLPVQWRPQHRNKLGNEFLLMTSSAAVAAELGGFDEELPIDPVEDAGRSDSESEDEGEDEGEREGEEEEGEEEDEEGNYDGL